MKLTSAQRAALVRAASETGERNGKVFAHSGIRLETARVLEKHGLMTVWAKAVSHYSRFSTRTSWDIDWVGTLTPAGQAVAATLAEVSV